MGLSIGAIIMFIFGAVVLWGGAIYFLIRAMKGQGLL